MRRIATYGAWMGGGLLLAAALLVFDMGTASAAAPRWAAIYGMAALILASLLFVRRPSFGWIDVAAMAVLAWLALSLLWSADYREGVLQWQKLASLTVVALFVRHCRFFDKALLPALALALLAAVVLAFSWPEVHGGFGNENFQAEALTIGAVLLLLIPDHSRTACLSWLSVAVGVSAIVYLFGWNGSHAQYAALMAGFAFTVVVVARGMWTHLRGPVIVSVFVMTAGGAVVLWRHSEAIWQSLSERAEIWLNTAVMIAQKPLFGHGFGSYEYAYPRTAHLRWLEGTFLGEPTDIIGAAHNDYLQLFAEAGLIGMALVAVLAWLIIKGERSSGDAVYRSAGLAGLFAAGALATVGFPFQTPAAAALIAVSAGFAARPLAKQFSFRPLRVIGLAVIPLFFSASMSYASAIHIRNVHRYISVAPALALKENLRAYEIYPLDSWVRLQMMLSLATILRNHPPDKVRLEPRAADRIFEISRSAVPEHPGALLARGQYLINSGRYRETDEIERIFEALHRRGSLYPQSWALEAIYAGLTSDEQRMEKTVLAALALPGGVQVFERMGFVQESEQ